jgi:hypothetical protein
LRERERGAPHDKGGSKGGDTKMLQHAFSPSILSNAGAETERYQKPFPIF